MRNTYPSAVETLDSLLRRLLCSGWEENLRSQAITAAARIATPGATDAPRHARTIGRGILSLLALRGEEAAGLQGDIGARLLDLMACLQDAGASGEAAPGA